MVPSDLHLDLDNIEISKKETTTIYRQEIRPSSQTGIGSLFDTLLGVLRKGRFTGKVTVNLNQGGVRDIVTEQKLEK